MGIEDRLKRLEDANPDLCKARPCQGPITRSQERLLEDGTVEVSGERPVPLCDDCPERDTIRHIVVRHGFLPGRDAWQVVDTESKTDVGTAILNVVYDG
jgi:hypothetical protein